MIIADNIGHFTHENLCFPRCQAGIWYFRYFPDDVTGIAPTNGVIDRCQHETRRIRPNPGLVKVFTLLMCDYCVLATSQGNIVLWIRNIYIYIYILQNIYIHTHTHSHTHRDRGRFNLCT